MTTAKDEKYLEYLDSLDAETEKTAREYTGFYEKAHASANFQAGADWGRRFGQKEILDSPELKALVTTVENVASAPLYDLMDDPLNVRLALCGVLAAFEKLKAKVGAKC